MSRLVSILPRAAIALAAGALSVAAQATTFNQAITTDGQWYAFSVDAGSASDQRATWIDLDYNSTAGNAQDLSFSFTVLDQAILRVVDLYAAGDTYSVTVSSSTGSSFSSSTSAVAQLDLSSGVFANDVDAAWADAIDFSRGQWLLAAGTYTVTGALLQSAKDGAGLALSTSGAVSVTAVPEPSSLALALAALASVIFVSRRRRQG